MSSDSQSLDALEREYRRPRPWLVLVYGAMVGLLTAFFVFSDSTGALGEIGKAEFENRAMASGSFAVN